MNKPTRDQFQSVISKTNEVLNKSAGSLNIPINLSLQNILIIALLCFTIWFLGEQKIKATYAKMFPKIDWQNPPDIDMSFDRGRFGCYYEYLEHCSPKAIEICDEKFVR